MRKLVLASTSPYRRSLLNKLGVPFIVDAPSTDEQEIPGESPTALVQRLAAAKAHDVGARHPDSLVIGSDQVASLNGMILGKPLTRDRAIEQLSASSGKTVVFYTGLCLLDTSSGVSRVTVEPYAVKFRDLDPERIEHYVDREEPFDCAGSFKSEGLGIALFESMNGRDPNSLVGLPLICLVDMLAEQGVYVP